MTDLLDLPGWTLTGRRTTVRAEVLQGAYLHEPIACPRPECDAPRVFHRHGTKTVMYADSPIRGEPVKLEATVRRYQCQGCNATFLQPLGGVHSTLMMTERCEAFIAKRALTTTNAAVAREVGLDEKTVRRVASKGVATLASHQHGSMPRVLGIDETRVGGKLRLVLADLDRNRLVDMLTDRQPATLRNWLASRAGTSTVDVVVIDLWRPYCTAIQAELPNATVVADKFHVLRLASDALVKVYARRKIAKPDRSAPHPFKRSKFTLLKRPAKLTETQEQDLKQWLREDEEIAAAYKVKEAFYAIFDLPRDQAIQAFDHFRETVPKAVRKDFRQLLAKMRVWRSEMLAILDHPKTNAYTESINGAIQTIVRSGNGYKFDIVRARILAKHALEPRKQLKLGQLMLPEGNFCGYCHEQFSASEMCEVAMPPMVAGEPAIQTMVCGTCRSEFDTDVLKAGRSRRPTQKAE